MDATDAMTSAQKGMEKAEKMVTERQTMEILRRKQWKY